MTSIKRSKLDAWIMEKENLEYLDRQALEQIQLHKLNRLLVREKERAGFYADRLPDQISDLFELKKIPFTTEEDLNKSASRMVLLSQSQIERVRTQETSGTTGYVKRVYYSEADNERTISFFAAGLSELIYPGEKTLICMPFSGFRGLGELIAEAVERLGACAIRAGIGKTYRELLELLSRERPQTFVGMPVPLLSLLRLAPDCSLKQALVSADACPETVIRQIEDCLGSKLYPHYGSRELGLGGAVTCPAFEGMHLRENDIIPEIIDKEGQVLPSGSWGELVITTIQADAMPLIRYRTGDYTRILPKRCPCGSVIHRLDRVVRIGEKSLMNDLDEILFDIPQVIDYQASIQSGHIQIRGYLTETPMENHVFPDELAGYPAHYQWLPFSENCMPCYPAKRSVQVNQK